MAIPEPTPEVTRRIELALQMIDMGALVFPLRPGTKVPLIPERQGGHGFHDAHGDREMAKTFLSQAGRPNYGVVFPADSDVIVFDLDGGDRDKRPGWQEDWQRLYDRLGPPGLTFIVRTPSGGRHAYYRWRTDLYGPAPPGDEMLGWTVRKPWKGYLVGPGSVVKGATYEPVGLTTIADLPAAWARAALAEKTGVRTQPSGPVLKVRGGPTLVEAGHRHAYLRDQARHLVGVGLRGDALFTAVWGLNLQFPEPKTEAEVRRAIGDAETKFEADELDPETGRPIHSAHGAGASGRKQPRPPEAIEGLPFHTAADICGMTPEEVDWAWRDYLAHGTIVEIIGPPKAGKTTLVFALIRAYVEGLPFLDRQTVGGPVVVLTEQGATSLRAALERTGIAGRSDVHFLLHRDVRAHEWPDVVETARLRCIAVGARLLVVDTLPAFAGLSGESENNAGDALAAMEPLLAAAGDGMAVLVNRHRRKGGADDIADEGRGSGAFSGAVDVVLSLRRKPGTGRPTVRVLAAASRFDETPEELYVELEEGRYVALGDDAAIEAAEARAAIVGALDAQDGQSMAELVDATGKSRQTLTRVLADLGRTGDVERRGTGSRGHPHRYHLVRDAQGIRSAQWSTPYGGEDPMGKDDPLTSSAVWSTPCRDYVAHQSHHHRTPTGWACRVCDEEDA